MSSRKNSIFEIRFLEELSYKNTIIHNIHPLSKFLVTICYILIVVSFGKYEISSLLPLIIYPVLILVLGEFEIFPLLKRMMIAMPFVIGLGIFNPILDQTTRMFLWGVPISGGWISFISLMMKSGFTVLAAFLLVATTGIGGIALSLRILRVPKIFILQFILTFRYISLLVEEVSRTYTAYMLRAPEQKGIGFRVWGSLSGQMLMRTFDRAQRVYEAMALRGFRGEYHPGGTKELVLKDILYCILWVMIFIIFRCINIPAWIGAVVTGVI